MHSPGLLPRTTSGTGRAVAAFLDPLVPVNWHGVLAVGEEVGLWGHKGRGLRKEAGLQCGMLGKSRGQILVEIVSPISNDSPHLASTCLLGSTRAGTDLSRPIGQHRVYPEGREQKFPYFKEASRFPFSTKAWLHQSQQQGTGIGASVLLNMLKNTSISRLKVIYLVIQAPTVHSYYPIKYMYGRVS